MDELGKCLQFYLKYSAEMERLYETDDPKAEVHKLKGLPNPDAVLVKLRRVGDAACREGAEFLEFCGIGVEDHFRAFCRVQQRRKNLEEEWDLQFWIWPKKAKNKRRRFLVGIGIDWPPIRLVPWVWCPGGRQAANELRRILPSTKREPNWGTSLIIKEIPITIPKRIEEPVPCKSMVDAVRRAFSVFTAPKVDEIARLASEGPEA